MTFAKRFLEARKKKHFTSQEVADLCGLSRSYITLIENGKRMPGKTHIPKIAVALGIKTNVVINWYLEDLREKLTP